MDPLCPRNLVHGLRDHTVPASEGAALYQAAVTAHRDGTSFMLPEADHRPTGALVAAVVDQVHAKLTTGAFDLKAPLDGIKIIPFGAAGPINP